MIAMKPKDAAEKVVSYVKEKGGSPTNAARELDIRFTPAIRKQVAEIEPNIKRWRYAHQRFGSWMTLPTETVADRNQQKILCVCLDCGTLKEVSLLALVAQRSSRCQNCALKNRTNLKVTSTDGEVFKSIRSFAAAIGQQQRYQTLRHQLLAGSVIEHNDQTYQLAAL